MGCAGLTGKVMKVFDAAALLIPRSNHVILNAPLKKVEHYVVSHIIYYFIILNLKSALRENINLCIHSRTQDRYIGEPIFYEGWFGQINWVDWDVTLEFGGQYTCTTTTTKNSGLMKTLHCPQSKIKEKTVPPHKGQIVSKDELELHELNWASPGWLFSVLGCSAIPAVAVITDVHVSQIIAYVCTCPIFKCMTIIVGNLHLQVAHVTVKWLSSLSNVSTPSPATNISGLDLERIVELDVDKRNWLALNTLCFYTVQKDDHVVDFNTLHNKFLEEFYGSEACCTEEDESAAKKRKKNTDVVSSFFFYPLFNYFVFFGWYLIIFLNL